jgi:diaminopimelate epimerase
MPTGDDESVPLADRATGTGHDGDVVGSALVFTKVDGGGLDVIVMRDEDGVRLLDARRARMLCDRGTGLGGDGIVWVTRTAIVEGFESDAEVAPWLADYRTANGRLGVVRGKVLMVLAHYLVDNRLARPGVVAVATRAGVRTVSVLEREVRDAPA